MQGKEEQMVREPAKGGSVRCLTPIPRLSRPCVALHIAPGSPQTLYCSSGAINNPGQHNGSSRKQHQCSF